MRDTHDTDDSASQVTPLCANCETPLPVDRWGIHTGCLGVSLHGGYAMFFDDVEGWPGYHCEVSSRLSVLLCHDCAARLLAGWPVFGGLLGRGQHSFEGGVPCCRWGYRMIRDERGVPVAVEYGDGSVVPYRLEGIVASMLDARGVAEGASVWSSASDGAVSSTAEVFQRERERIARLIDEDTSGG